MSRSAVLRRTPARHRAAGFRRGHPYDAGFLTGAGFSALLFLLCGAYFVLVILVETMR